MTLEHGSNWQRRHHITTNHFRVGTAKGHVRVTQPQVGPRGLEGSPGYGWTCRHFCEGATCALWRFHASVMGPDGWLWGTYDPTAGRTRIEPPPPAYSFISTHGQCLPGPKKAHLFQFCFWFCQSKRIAFFFFFLFCATQRGSKAGSIENIFSKAIHHGGSTQCDKRYSQPPVHPHCYLWARQAFSVIAKGGRQYKQREIHLQNNKTVSHVWDLAQPFAPLPDKAGRVQYRYGSSRGTVPELCPVQGGREQMPDHSRGN